MLIKNVVLLKGLKNVPNTSHLTNYLRANSELLLKTVNNIFRQITNFSNIVAVRGIV